MKPTNYKTRPKAPPKKIKPLDERIKEIHDKIVREFQEKMKDDQIKAIFPGLKLPPRDKK